MIGEIKNRKAKFSIKEAKEFQVKAKELMNIEKLQNVVLFVFSLNGFYKNTIDYLKKHGIAWTEDSKWLKKGLSV